MSLGRKVLAEFIGTALLLACVVGSGVMGVNLADGNAAIALLANAGATAGILYVLIVVLGPVSGAHFNPVVTLVMRWRGELRTHEALAYVVVQIVAAVAGVLLAHAMFDLPLLQPGTRIRTGDGQWLSEGVATFGLVLTILLGLRHRPAAIPALVAGYIFAAYWFTASTSFANPAVTLARALTQTFAGIRPGDVAGFVLAQLVGAVAALAVARAFVAHPQPPPGRERTD
ncbi:Glycerol uptake facilitator (Major Intrinsic Protein Family) [Pseudoxanthomonas sp. CF385]|uniref:aquaporin n=1 Tax=Pseudoxanthomonas sp. CF385 TaxID=1881042 RepID=UPI00087E8679|nr:aquaporin [Pseudoxanthomonas sp. CF385]SDQ55915.1 Glycerol uptake facilitator (Major Intrinsic Protein Family) [Pseudoxanthomonas sp. CF385]